MAVFRANATALITGGASGVGFAVAQLCLKHGMKVALADWSRQSLHDAAKTLGAEGAVGVFDMDVSREDAWPGLKENVEKKFGPVDFLMLNAGVTAKGSWGDGAYFNKMLSTNLLGVINGLNAFVPAFQARASSDPSAIVITGSKQGITNPPGNPAYNASRSAVKSLAEHLSFDLKDTATAVHLLVPDWTFTALERV